MTESLSASLSPSGMLNFESTPHQEFAFGVTLAEHEVYIGTQPLFQIMFGTEAGCTWELWTRLDMIVFAAHKNILMWCIFDQHLFIWWLCGIKARTYIYYTLLYNTIHTNIQISPEYLGSTCNMLSKSAFKRYYPPWRHAATLQSDLSPVHSQRCLLPLELLPCGSTFPSVLLHVLRQRLSIIAASVITFFHVDLIPFQIIHRERVLADSCSLLWYLVFPMLKSWRFFCDNVIYAYSAHSCHLRFCTLMWILQVVM